MKLLKLIGFPVLAIGLAITTFKIYDVNFNYRLREVSKNKVYSSGTIPPKHLEQKLQKLGIKTVIDLRIDNNYDPLNPASESRILAEKRVIEQMENVQYVNIPSKQIPTEDNINRFLTVLNNSDAYPVLIHCHHGIGRAVLYSAIYRIEFENFSNEKARTNTCFPTAFSNFDKKSSKGKWLLQYNQRRIAEK